MESVLKPTYGIMVYQEQVMQITRLLAGFTGCEADKVRKAMGKKKKDVLDSMREKFLKGCFENKTCSQEIANEIWSDMESFASYAFNKSHAAGYGYTAYQCAFLKTYYPAEFMAAQLTVEGGDSSYEVVEKYEKKLFGMNIKLLPLDLNDSRDDYIIHGFGDSVQIRKGFKGVKGIGEEAYKDLVAGQPFSDIYDFCFRGELATKSDVVKVLVNSGALDFLKPKMEALRRKEVTRNDLFNEFELMMKRAKVQKRSNDSSELRNSMIKPEFASATGEEAEGLSFDF
jgi:DNA polymerase-3 subunit alpha